MMPASDGALKKELVASFLRDGEVPVAERQALAAKLFADDAFAEKLGVTKASLIELLLALQQDGPDLFSERGGRLFDPENGVR